MMRRTTGLVPEPLVALIAAAVGLLAALAATIGLVVLIEGRSPDDMSRSVGYPGWMGWAALLSAAHAVGGIAGGVLIALIDRSRPARTAFWGAGVTFIVLSAPALGAFDRPIEMGSMVFLNLLTSLGIFVGSAIVSALLSRRTGPSRSNGADRRRSG